jgi:hypothetical protein
LILNYDDTRLTIFSTETFGAMLALGTLIAELSQHRPTQQFITNHQRLLAGIVAPALMLIGGWIGSYPQEHPEWSPWSRNLHDFLTNPFGDGSHGSLIVPKGSDAQRRTTAFFIMCWAITLFITPSVQRLLSHRLLLWLGHHSFAVYLVHGCILRTFGIWIAYGISGEPWEPAGVNPDGTRQEQKWIAPRGRPYIMTAILVFIVLTYTAAWAWMRWVDSACARATQWLENKVFEDESENAAAMAEKGYARVNGNDHSRYHDGDRSQPPP